MAYTFKEVSSDEIAPFLATHPHGSFAQSIAMAQVRSDMGRDIAYIAVFDGDTMVAGAQISFIKGRFASADITNGPLLDFGNKKLVEFFTTELRTYLKNQGCVYATISPYVPFDEKILHFLQLNGWKYSGRINASTVGIRGNIRWIYVKDLAGQTVDTYRDAYAKRHRRYIKNHHPDLELRQLKRDELPLFLDIMKHTAERRQFSSRSDDYFYSLYDHFGEAAQFLVVELDKKTPVAAILFIEMNGEVISFLGGAVVDHAKYRGTYLLHDAMIRYAIEKGYARYNFYGIEGKINDPSSEGYGIYQFKSKFGTGEAVELLGEFVLPVHGLKYALFKIARNILGS